MRRLFIALAAALALAGCAIPKPAPIYYQSPAVSAQIEQSERLSREIKSGRQRLERLQQLLGKTMSPVDGDAIRKDIEEQKRQIDELETQLAGLPAIDRRAYQPAAASTISPCVTTTCGSVNVQGYYRKDGTYVRPHTRSRGRR